MVDPSNIDMKDNSEQYQDGQSAADKAAQADKGVKGGPDRDSEEEN